MNPGAHKIVKGGDHEVVLQAPFITTGKVPPEIPPFKDIFDRAIVTFISYA